ncbi:unnamed protein product [Adineta steineri]|uniref:Ferric reductase NAD binding domain-containing protein n=1 Tax=Adineta steineri TaxID=433720 RepID=A0A815MXS0_9BILA|nr:unnamed protein product [Adineta steineri]CAF3898995.1 unnamed protein product [Adineta steineri]
MVICSFQCIRQRSGCYQLFRYTHYLFWPIFILLVLHAPNFWKWAIGPMVLFCFETIYLFKRHLPKYGRTKLISIGIEDEHVLSLMIKLYYKELLSFEQNSDRNSQITEITVDNLNNDLESNSRNLLVYPKEITFIDKQKDALCFAFESLIYELREQRFKCSRCSTMNYTQSFRNILDEFETEQESYLAATTPSSTTNSQSRYLDIHLYCTSIHSNEQTMLRNLPYHLVANMYEVIRHEDVHTQLRTPTHVGRPPWKLLFAKFKAEHRSTNVFFIGYRIMADEIKKHCNEHSFRFQHEPYF